ncbi:MAG: PilN domain-containing protein [Chromatiaceae bacterium]|jgi:type IV pilus assembly protein PilN|nr:PilN domain-containing protein [Chromatiaceae bacterium]
MAHINLLPWREKLRKQRQRDFGLTILGALLLTVLGVGYWGFIYVQGMIDHQGDRNSFLDKEIVKVDKEIREIRDLEKTRQQLIARMKVIEDLQVSRPQIVHLFDDLVTVVPDGAYLSEMTQRGRNLVLKGRAQSNARVSTYMRNIEASPWLNDPKLRIIENKDQDRTATVGNTFQLDLVQVVPKEESAK